MTKLGASIIRGLKQALAYAEGTPDEGQYVVHYGESRISIPRKANERALPIPPGEFLREDFLIPLRMTAQMLAGEIKAPVRRVVAIVEERRGLDPEMCLRLARYFRMSPGFWMNVQKSYELGNGNEELADDLQRSPPCIRKTERPAG